MTIEPVCCGIMQTRSTKFSVPAVGDPVATQSSVAENSKQLCGSEEQFFRGDLETKCLGDPGNDIEPDTNVSCIKECARTDTSPVHGLNIFRTDFRRK
jgi:hypothetical protein